MSRIISNISIDEIREFKYNLIKAREIAGKLQCGEEVTPVHLQTNTDGYYTVKKGHNKVAALAILGRESVVARFSTFPANEYSIKKEELNKGGME